MEAIFLTPTNRHVATKVTSSTKTASTIAENSGMETCAVPPPPLPRGGGFIRDALLLEIGIWYLSGSQLQNFDLRSAFSGIF